MALKFLHIEIQENGDLSVTGHITEKELCYKMLDGAKSLIGQHIPGMIITPPTDGNVYLMPGTAEIKYN